LRSPGIARDLEPAAPNVWQISRLDGCFGLLERTIALKMALAVFRGGQDACAENRPAAKPSG
jgi:hypothetical protein